MTEAQYYIFRMISQVNYKIELIRNESVVQEKR